MILHVFDGNLRPGDLEWRLVAHLRKDLGRMRFTAKVACVRGQPRKVRISCVRLRKAKPYCGNHAKACENPHPVGGHRRRNFLEGADWVEFNDWLNDLLDAEEMDVNVYSMVCWVRKRRARRIRYASNQTRGVPGSGNFEHVWDRDGPSDHYRDCIGQEAPRAWFPSGTPGINDQIGYFEEG